MEVVSLVDSTNTMLLNLHSATKWHLLVAERQVAGRGRNGRNWYAPAGNNLHFSLAYTHNNKSSALNGLSLVIGICIYRVLSKLKIAAKLKWPNDVLVDGRKISGILIENKISPRTIKTVIGVGLNCDLGEEIPAELRGSVCDLKGILGHRVDKERVLAMIVDEILSTVPEFFRLGFGRFIKEWNKADSLHGSQISLRIANKLRTGLVLGVSEQGLLGVALGPVKVNLLN